MFFSPIVAKIGSKPFICYVDTDLVKHPDGITETSVHDRIEVFGQNWRYFSVSGRKTTEFVPEDTDFMIGFLWTDGQKVYVDVWIQRQLGTYGECAPMTTLQSFDSHGLPLDPWKGGNACGDTRIVSGWRADLPPLPLPKDTAKLTWEMRNNPHIMASAIEAALLSDPSRYRRVIDYLADRLVRAQRPDGSWRSTLVLSVPYPDEEDPRWIAHTNADYGRPTVTAMRVVSALNELAA